MVFLSWVSFFSFFLFSSYLSTPQLPLKLWNRFSQESFLSFLSLAVKETLSMTPVSNLILYNAFLHSYAFEPNFCLPCLAFSSARRTMYSRYKRVGCGGQCSGQEQLEKAKHNVKKCVWWLWRCNEAVWTWRPDHNEKEAHKWAQFSGSHVYPWGLAYSWHGRWSSEAWQRLTATRQKTSKVI